MLADVGDDDGLTASFFPEIIDDVRGIEVPAIGQALNIAHSGIAFQLCDVANPHAMVASFDVWCEPLKYLAGIADEGGVNLDVLVDFGAVNLDMNLAGALGVSAKVAGDAVVETHSNRDKQVGLLDGVVHPGFAVHAHHAKVQRFVGREAADAEKRHGDGIISCADELFEGAHGP